MLALRLHPDECEENGSEEAFKQVGEAFSALSDADRRQKYDEFGADALRGEGSGRGGEADFPPKRHFEVHRWVDRNEVAQKMKMKQKKAERARRI
eukprot:Skav234887  [mRNA]  locus=scaffold840:545643:545927:- [translate_table: standard]